MGRTHYERFQVVHRATYAVASSLLYPQDRCYAGGDGYNSVWDFLAIPIQDILYAEPLKRCFQLVQ